MNGGDSSGKNSIASPMQFDFFIGGYAGESYRLHVKDGILNCETLAHGYQDQPELTKFIPIDDNPDFKAAIEYVKSKKWKSLYENPGVMDGTNWNLIIESDNFSINTGGDNAYPPGFFKFLKLVNVVTKTVGLRVA